jgi:Fe-S cluster biogenesis protein NfuA
LSADPGPAMSPGSESEPTPDPGSHDADVLHRRRAELDELIAVCATAVAADGGVLSVLDADVAAGVVTVQLSGACGSCAISARTLSDGLERILRSRLDWLTELVGVVADSEVAGRGSWVAKP